MSFTRTRFTLLFAVLFLLIPITAFAHSGKKDGPGGKACRADMQQYCPGVKPGEGRVLACLKEHSSQLQAACQAKLPLMEKHHQMKQTCQVDREKFCGQAARGKEVKACMRKNHDLLSEPCRAAIDELKAQRKTHPLPKPATPAQPGTEGDAPSATYWDNLRGVYI